MSCSVNRRGPLQIYEFWPIFFVLWESDIFINYILQFKYYDNSVINGLKYPLTTTHNSVALAISLKKIKLQMIIPQRDI